MSFITEVQNLSKRLSMGLGDLITGRFDVMPDPDPRILGAATLASPYASIYPSEFSAYLEACRTPQGRIKEMEYYDFLETEIPDCRRGLEAFVAMTTTGNLAGGGTTTFNIRPLNTDKKYPKELLERLSSREMLIRSQSPLIMKGMIKYGTYTPQLVIDQLTDGRLGVSRLKHLPPGTIFRNVAKDGSFSSDKFWVQVIDGKVVGSDEMWTGMGAKTGIPQWELANFSVWTNIVNATRTLLYGTSILQPFGAIALKVQGMLDAVVVARLSRAAARYKVKIDVSDFFRTGNINEAGAMRRVKAFQRAMTRSKSMISSGGPTDSYQKAPVPDGDFFIPAGKDLEWDVDMIQGDMNLGNIKDIEMMFRVYFGALGVPPEYVGHERSQGGRSVLSQIDIHFARTVRSLQLFASAGFEHLVEVDMLVGGWDPREYPIEVVPPRIGARDDLLHAQIMALRAGVVATLAAAGMDLTVNPQWILETFLSMREDLEGLAKDDIDKIFKDLEKSVDGKAAAPTGSRAEKIKEAIASMDQAARASLEMLLGFPQRNGFHYQTQPTPDELAEQTAEIIASNGRFH